METKSKRILFLDLMRTFAVLMMIQGHTIDTFLSQEFRTFDSVFYSAWYSMRGFTAPIFMFTAGVVFTYLLKLENYSFRANPRIKKGFKRIITLITIGYLLRYPTARIFDFSVVSDSQWQTFFTVDALHLIGFGLFAIIISVYLSKSFTISFKWLIIIATLSVFTISPLIVNIDWATFLPLPLAAYFYKDTGSFFPLFPWIGYVTAGSILGYYLAKNPAAHLKTDFSIKLLLIGLVLIGLSFIFALTQKLMLNDALRWSYNYSVVSLRIGVVVLMNGAMAFFARRLTKIPDFLILLGRHTLLLYVIHLIILYGCAWFSGLNFFFGKSFNASETIAAVVAMYSLMLLVILFVSKWHILKKQKLVTANP